MNFIGKIGFALLLALLIGMVSYIIWDQKNAVVVRYVDTITLFNSFHLTKKLQAEHQPILSRLKSGLDSLNYLYSNNEKHGAKKELEEEIIRVEQDLMNFDQQSTQKINTVVWNRLNPLINSFGKRHDYDIVVGANGMGNVLYGKDTYDITDEVLKYCNKEYKDEN